MSRRRTYLDRPITAILSAARAHEASAAPFFPGAAEQVGAEPAASGARRRPPAQRQRRDSRGRFVK